MQNMKYVTVHIHD